MENVVEGCCPAHALDPLPYFCSTCLSQHIVILFGRLCITKSVLTSNTSQALLQLLKFSRNELRYQAVPQCTAQSFPKARRPLSNTVITKQANVKVHFVNVITNAHTAFHPPEMGQGSHAHHKAFDDHHLSIHQTSCVPAQDLYHSHRSNARV